MQLLNLYISLREFTASANKETHGSFSLFLQDHCVNLARQRKESYGLSLIREAIRQYEIEQGLQALNASKAAIPFFRSHQARLIGPEMTLFSYSLFEKTFVPEEVRQSSLPWLRISIDYASLAEYCLLNNFYLIRCKYNQEENLHYLKQKIAEEYEGIFFNEQETGFKPSSRFFSLLYQACLEMEQPENENRAEWRILAIAPPEHASYRYENDTLLSYFTADIPLTCIREIQLLPDYRQQIANYTSLIGLLSQLGLRAGSLIKEMKDEDSNDFNN